MLKKFLVSYQEKNTFISSVTVLQDCYKSIKSIHKSIEKILGEALVYKWNPYFWKTINWPNFPLVSLAPAYAI